VRDLRDELGSPSLGGLERVGEAVDVAGQRREFELNRWADPFVVAP
jgi:hypothetical protein